MLKEVTRSIKGVDGKLRFPLKAPNRGNKPHENKKSPLVTFVDQEVETRNLELGKYDFFSLSDSEMSTDINTPRSHKESQSVLCKKHYVKQRKNNIENLLTCVSLTNEEIEDHEQCIRFNQEDTKLIKDSYTEVINEKDKITNLVKGYKQRIIQMKKEISSKIAETQELELTQHKLETEIFFLSSYVDELAKNISCITKENNAINKDFKAVKKRILDIHLAKLKNLKKN